MIVRLRDATRHILAGSDAWSHKSTRCKDSRYGVSRAQWPHDDVSEQQGFLTPRNCRNPETKLFLESRVSRKLASSHLFQTTETSENVGKPGFFFCQLLMRADFCQTRSVKIQHTIRTWCITVHPSDRLASVECYSALIQLPTAYWLGNRSWLMAIFEYRGSSPLYFLILVFNISEGKLHSLHCY